MALSKCIARRSDFAWVRGGYFEPTWDQATEACVVFVDEIPDPRLTRWDGALGKRPATQAEIDAYDADMADARATSDFDAQLALKALALVMLDEINTIRAALVPPLPARTPTQLRNAYIAKRKALG